MAIKTISKSIEIKAPAETVWQVLFDDETYRVWSEAFAPGSYAVTDWQTGSRIEFLDQTRSGLIAEVHESNPPYLMSINHLGIIRKGTEDTSSEEAKLLTGAKEIYRLNEDNGVTRLEIASDMAEKYYNDMSDSWDKALRKIKDLAESR